MPKNTCSICGTADMFITLKNGEKLPQFSYSIATGLITCMPCKETKTKETKSGILTHK